MDISSLLEKYGLPSQEKLEEELGLLQFEEKDDVLLGLCTLLREKIHKYSSYLHRLIQPDSDMVELHEAESFTEQEREQLYVLFSQLHHQIKKFYLVDLSPSQEAYASYFLETFQLWLDKKREVHVAIQTILDSWNREYSSSQQQHYFG